VSRDQSRGQDEIAVGTRGSKLALVQAELVRAAFADAGYPSRIVIVETDGDRRRPDTAWGEGAFVAAIEAALLDGRVDVAVHSAKDLPTDLDSRLEIGAYLARADPRDALVVRAGDRAGRLADLPAGTRVGTDSPRRTGFLRAHRPDLDIHPLHGNVDTRLRRLDEGETDALILACAGLDRLGLGDRISERLAVEVVPPAPGQGAIAVQVRRADARLVALTAAIDDRPTRTVVESERAFLHASGGGCRAPIGAQATIANGQLELLGGYARVDGSGTAFVRQQAAEDAGAELAIAVARALEAEFGRSPGRTDGPTDGRTDRRATGRVLVTRPADQSAELVAELAAVGLEAVLVPAIAIEPVAPGGELDRAARGLADYAWVVITSANGAGAIVAAAERASSPLGEPRWAAIGQATASALRSAGVTVDHVPKEASTRALAAELPVVAGQHLLVVRGELAGTDLAERLRARGVSVDDVIGYRTREAPIASQPLLRRALDGEPIDAIVFTSGSAVRGLIALAAAEAIPVTMIPAICAGPATAGAARSAGFVVLAESARPESAALARAAREALDRSAAQLLEIR
jgi:hydroxymethylbilane synthase